MMIPSHRSRYWHSRLASSFVVGGVITLTGAIPFAGIAPCYANGIATLRERLRRTLHAFSGNCALAQVIQDGSAGTIVTPINDTTFEITKGTTVEGDNGLTNLFHSFISFSIPDEGIAHFLNNPTITNIFARVTGESPSDIQGTIRAEGNANLFLINPNGIVFGQNARLDIGGSFVGTTANAIAFGDQGFFSASEPNIPPLLTVNPSAFFFNQIAAKPIENESIARAEFDLSGLPVSGLRVPNGQSLLLLGGDVAIQGGRLQALGGRIELGGVSGVGTVWLNVDGNDLRLSFPDGVARADVSITDGAHVSTIAEGGGSIAINAKRVDILGRSNLMTGIGLGLGSVDSRSGDIEINATGLITVSDSSLIANIILGGIGSSGNIRIAGQSVNIANGAGVSTSSFGQGDGGNVTIQAIDNISISGADASGISSGIISGPVSLQAVSDSIAAIDISSILGVDADDFLRGILSYLLSLFGFTAVGNGGDINLEAPTIFIGNGVQVSTSNIFGQGKAGNIQINASDSVSLTNRSALQTSTVGIEQGDGGDITIDTGSLFVTNGSKLDTSSIRELDTDPLSLINNAGVPTDTIGQGNAGNIQINAAESVELIGSSSGLFTEAQGIGSGGNLTLDTRRLIVRDGANMSTTTGSQGSAGTLSVMASESVELKGRGGLLTGTVGDGRAGDLRIVTDQLIAQDEAVITVGSFGSGKAGNLEVTARSIQLDNRSSFTAITTQSSDGGNITLELQDFLLLRRGSPISTTAGLAGVGGDGGNITIHAPESFIVAVPSENSDITANAFEGRGGNINITAQGIYGLEYRPRPTPQSDITVSSDFGVDGVVEINTPDIDPTRGLATLPAEPVNPQVAQSCQPGGAETNSEFVVTGRGGLPPNPREALSSDAVEVNLVTLNPSEENRSRQAVSTNPTRSTPAPIVEAQGWVINAKGEVVLTATAPNVTPHSSWQTPEECTTS